MKTYKQLIDYLKTCQRGLENAQKGLALGCENSFWNERVEYYTNKIEEIKVRLAEIESLML